MGRPGKVSGRESPSLGVSPSHGHRASRTQLPGSQGFPEPSRKLRGAPHKAWLFWGDLEVTVFPRRSVSERCCHWRALTGGRME